MSKKRVIIFSALIIGILIIFNIYLYNSNNNVNNHIEQNVSSAQSLANISNFRIDINRMSQAQKLYILTLKDEYKSEYEFYLNKVYNEINELYANGNIDSTDKTELMNALNEYKSLNNTLIKNIVNTSISENTESILVNANECQIKLLLKLDNSIDFAKSSIDTESNIVKGKTDNQVTIMQTISTLITGIISFFIYFFKKYSKPEDLGDFIKCIDNIETDKENQSKSNSENNIELINEKILKYEQMLDIIHAVYKQNTKLKCNLDKCEMIIKDLRKSISKLSQDSNTCNDYAKNMIDDISEQLIELKILFESLPIYEDSLSDLYNIINKNND